MIAGALAIRADGGASIGAGHVMRSLALADAWQRRGGTVDWFCTPLPAMLDNLLGSRGIALRRLEHAEDWDAVRTWSAEHRGAWVSIDGYGFCRGADGLHAAGARVLVIDDDGRWPRYTSDLLLNQNIGAERVSYRAAPSTRRLLGPSFVLLRSEFRRQTSPVRSVDQPARRLFVSFGGHDARGLTRRVAQLLLSTCSDVEVDAAGGVVADVIPPVSTRLRWHVGTDLSAVMREADLAVVSAGSICYELAYLGVPALTVIVADNQQGIAHGLHRAGVARDLGWADELSDRAIVDAVESLRHDPARGAMSRAGRALVDGDGADRVLLEMLR